MSKHSIAKSFLLMALLAMLSFGESRAEVWKWDDDDCTARGFVGVTSEVPSRSKLRRIDYEPRGGAYLTNVVGCTGAEEAGLQPLDYLISVDGEETTQDRHFFCLLQDIEPGTVVEVGYIRQGTQATTSLRIGRRGDRCQERAVFPKRGFFGIQGARPVSQGGVIIEVSSGGPVAELGLRTGDRLLSVNDYPIGDWSDVSTVKRLLLDLESVEFVFERDGATLTIKGALPEHSANAYAGRGEGSWDWDWNDGSGKVWHQGRWIDSSIASAQAALDEIDFGQIERDVEKALADVDFERIERDVDEAVQSIDFAEISREASQAASEALREALEGLREARDEMTNGRGDRTRASSRTIVVSSITAEDLMNRTYGSATRTAIEALELDALNVRQTEDDELRVSFMSTGNSLLSVHAYSERGTLLYGYETDDFDGRFNKTLGLGGSGAGPYTLLVKNGEKAAAWRISLGD